MVPTQETIKQTLSWQARASNASAVSFAAPATPVIGYSSCYLFVMYLNTLLIVSPILFGFSNPSLILIPFVILYTLTRGLNRTFLILIKNINK